MNAIELALFRSRIAAVCDEMGITLQRTALSPNIRDRLDFSCAVFDAQGELCAQAAHIPVHLGSMAYAMSSIVQAYSWQPDEMVVLNDPYLGGTHLPDITVIAPLFLAGDLLGFIVNRAHHADIGAETPGSMPIATTLAEEGIILPPTVLYRKNHITPAFQSLLQNMRQPEHAQGDFAAQISANKVGLQRLSQLVTQMGTQTYLATLTALNSYAERLALQTLQTIPPGHYHFIDHMDDDGMGQQNIAIHVSLEVTPENLLVDFAGTAQQVAGNINCPLSVAAAAVFYVFRCLMPTDSPACAGLFKRIHLSAPTGCLVNAQRPAAVAAGNVETSTRITDAVIGALSQALPHQLPAASHGSMNNLAMGRSDGAAPWDYYETMGGGMGASPQQHGLHAVQTHMTNTLNTPIEVLETQYPLRLKQYSIRPHSGGKGQHHGGNGLIREYEFLAPATATLLTERRLHAPWGANGGQPGATGLNLLNDQPLAPKQEVQLAAGDCLKIATPGGGGWGKPAATSTTQSNPSDHNNSKLK